MKQSFSAASILLLLVASLAGCQPTRTQATRASITSSIAPTEGMWLPNALPLEHLKSEFGFAPSQQWLDNLRLASVRIGASGAFVSADGLILTNHHVAVDGLQNISRPGKDYVAEGFLAKSQEDEVQLPGMEISVLESIEDVTSQVNQAVDPKLNPDSASKARNAAITNIERESQNKTGLQSNIVRLYGGALYHLYRYKRYSDVRIVFAPEVATAFFGGDPDNFEYPRYCLDMALLRAYENGKPVHVDHFLKISPKGVSDGDLIFVSGHPGSTDRLRPVAALKVMRDVTLPLRIESLQREESALLNYSRKSEEARRQAQEEIFFVQNSLKAMRPELAALKETNLLQSKQREEDAIRSALRQRPDLRGYEQAWTKIAQAENARAKLHLKEVMLENGRAFSSGLFWQARQLVRLAAEDGKPDAQRLPPYTQARRESLEQDLFADQPIYPDLEIAELTASLRWFSERMGTNSDEAKQVLHGEDPATFAQGLVRGTKLASVAERKRIRAGGAAEIAASTDPMIVLARSIDEESRAVHATYEAKVQEPQTQALTDINRARFALAGTALYPDATGTLRLSYGIVRGYEQDGSHIAPWTDIQGAFDHENRHGATWPYALPKSWSEARGSLALQTPLNFVSTADITGGNSGSPVVNRDGELVGLIFDSNRQGVPNNLAYTDIQARAVSVDSRAILEALHAIYHADRLLAELRGDSK